MKKEEFDDFFKPYSENVDLVDKSSKFWQLSDKIILELIKKHILTGLKSNSIIMDAGGGTGRWVVKMSAECNSDFIIYDKSEHMLTKAEVNIKSANIDSRVSIVNGDLINMSQVDNDSVDSIVSIYSPISFIYQPEKALKELYRVLKPGGRMFLMSHGYHNALAFKINGGADVNDLKKLYKEKIVKWAPHVPDLLTNSKESLENKISSVGFTIVSTFGVLVLVQPGLEDFSPTNDGESSISRYLSDSEIFDTIFEIEMDINSEDTVANRGMNMFTIAHK